MFDDYIDKEKRDNLLKSAQTLNYSNKKVSQLQKVFDNYNQDIFTYNIALDIIDMQSHVKEHQKEGFLSKIANIIMWCDIKDTISYRRWNKLWMS